jgi:hypothetical protein
LSYEYDKHVGKPKEQAALSAMDAETAKMKRTRDEHRAAMGWAPIGDRGATTPGAVATAQDDRRAQADMLAAAFVTALNAGLKNIKVVNQTGGPVSLAIDESASGAGAGSIR